MSGRSKPFSQCFYPAGTDPQEALYRLYVKWGDIGGRREPVEFGIEALKPADAGPITGTVLRSLPIGRLIDSMREGQRALSEWAGDSAELIQAWEKEGPKARLGVEHYRAVADVYTEAFTAGSPPTKAVAEAFHVSPSTAASWVSRARNKYELLAETPMGKAGV